MTSADEFVLKLLNDKGLLEEDELDFARSKVTEAGYEGSHDTAVLESLISDHVITQKQIASALAEEFNMETVELADIRLSAEALKVVPFELANRYKVLPLESDDSEIELAVFDPLDMDAIYSISHVIQRSIVCRVAPLEEIEKAIHQYYEGSNVDKVDEMFSDM